MGQTIHIGLVGCGKRSRSHVAGFREVPDAKITAVCDLDESSAQAIGGPLGAAVYRDIETMLDNESLDAVCIVAPAYVRGVLEVACIDRGVPFLIEKPVATDLQTAQKVAARVKEAGVIAAVAYQLRYGSAARAIRRWSETNRVGLAEGRYWCGFARARGVVAEDPRIGGQLLEQVTHTFDLMRHWIGDVVEVFAYQGRTLVEEPGKVNDSSAIALKFANGAIATVSSTWGSFEKPAESNIVTLFAGDQRIEYRRDRTLIAPEGELPPLPGPTLHEAFVAAVQSGDPRSILTPYDEAVRTLAVSLAANESAETGRPVRLDERSVALGA